MSTPDWESMMEQAAQAGGDRAPGLKADLPAAYVLERWNYPVIAEGEELRAVCPFHDDTNPSLTVYRRDAGDRYKCFSCGAGGDVLDLVSQLGKAEGFADTLDKAEALLAEMREEGWKGPELGVKRPFDFEAARAYVQEAEVRSPDAVYALLNGKPGWRALADVDPAELVATWGLGSAGDWAVIPYYRRDQSLVTYKRRRADTPALSAAGSDFSEVLYGEWLDTDPSTPVVLTEGESDAWAAWSAIGSTHAVLSLPTGAGAHPKPAQLAGLKGRTVTLAFDGDPAGRAATVRWAAALRLEATVLIAALPDGADLAGLDNVADVLRGARPLVPPPDGITVADGVWARLVPKGKEEVLVKLGNWSFQPDRELRGEGVVAYEGTVLPWGERTVLKSTHMETATKLNAWATAHGGTFTGTDKDARSIQQYLQAQGPFLAQGSMTTVAGLWKGTFVWPGDSIGRSAVTYVPPAADVHLENYTLGLGGGDFDPALPLRLRRLHRKDVMDPILAWLAVAPLRSLVREFPVLAVTGSSGSGKTTLLETVIGRLTGSSISVNLTSTTPHAMFSYLGASNAFPVWVDEYRPGARLDTKGSFDQALRDAYTKQASAKGGMGERWAEVRSLPALAPIVVSGEDAFVEKSHLDRMVSLPLPRDGRRPEVLAEMQKRPLDGWARAYLAFLADSLFTEGAPEDLPTDEWGPEELPHRMRINLGVLKWGWDVLTFFLAGYGLTLGEPDFSLVIAQYREDMDADPVRAAILWVRDEAQADAVWQIEDQVYVSPESLVDYLHKHPGVVTLPGGVEAVRRILRDDPYNAQRVVTKSFGGQQRRAWVFPASVLGEVE